MNKSDLIIFISTLITFSFEALFHYNIGKNGMTKIEFPSISNIIKLIGVVVFFSYLNTLISNIISKYIDKEK